MPAQLMLFYFFAGLTLISSIMVIGSRNPVHSVLFLILAFCNSAGLLLLLEIEFLAMIFIVVYVGAIAVLFLFVVMMLNIKISEVQDEIYQYLPVGGLIGFIFLSEIFLILESDFVPLLSQNLLSTDYNIWVASTESISNIATLGQVLYTTFAVFFLIAGLILLVAMIGAIVLTMQTRTTLRRQQIYQQTSRDFENAVFLSSGLVLKLPDIKK
jgi:NADH:ubiquinone oxidoreductase subunit 6 (subunit J)